LADGHYIGGPTAASFMSYGIAKRLSSRHANFGKGEPEGIVAPEAADHAAMLSLGIPGSATAAVNGPALARSQWACWSELLSQTPNIAHVPRMRPPSARCFLFGPTLPASHRRNRHAIAGG